jgi:hypothetical protein
MNLKDISSIEISSIPHRHVVKFELQSKKAKLKKLGGIAELSKVISIEIVEMIDWRYDNLKTAQYCARLAGIPNITPSLFVKGLMLVTNDNKQTNES